MHRIKQLIVLLVIACSLIPAHVDSANEKRVDFFPFGVYIGAPGFKKNADLFDYSVFDSFEAALIDMKKKYVNIISIENTNQFINTGQMREILAISSKYNMKVWASYEIPENLNDVQLNNLYINKFLPYSNEESLFAWALRDEPKLNERKYLENAVRLLINHDNKNHIGFNHGGRGLVIKNIAKLSDFVTVNGYPVYEHYKNPWSITKITVESIKKTQKPVWINLQAHSWIDRHVQPSPAELRLMIHLAIANGAKGLFYFMYNYRPYWDFKYIEHSLVDVWLNPSPLWSEVKKTGKRLTAIGPLLLSTSPSDIKGIKLKGKKVSIKVLRDSEQEIDYLVVYNNDTSSSASTTISLDKKFLNNRKVYDLYDMIDLKKTKPLISRFELNLRQGDGKVLAVCTEKIFENISRKVWESRFKMEREILEIGIARLEKSGFDVTRARKTLGLADVLLTKKPFGALTEIELAQQTLNELKNKNSLYAKVQNNLEKTRTLFAKIDKKLNNAVNKKENKYVEKYKDRVVDLSKDFFQLEYRFYNGKYKTIKELIFTNKDNVYKLYRQMSQ